eukprot:Rmarinus@m.6831
MMCELKCYLLLRCVLGRVHVAPLLSIEARALRTCHASHKPASSKTLMSDFASSKARALSFDVQCRVSLSRILRRRIISTSTVWSVRNVKASKKMVFLLLTSMLRPRHVFLIV